MRRILTASALAALVALTAATGQPPKPAETDKKAPDPADTAIAAALTNDPDVKMARAKLQLAEAELAKARQAVTLRVVALRASVEEYKTAVDVAQQRKNIAERIAGKGSSPELLDARITLEAAKAKLVTAETELKLLTGGGSPAVPATSLTPLGTGITDEMSQAMLWWTLRTGGRLDDPRFAPMYLNRTPAATQGPIPDRIRGALDKQVKLGAKGEVVTFPKAMEVFKEAGLDVTARGEIMHPQPDIDPVTGRQRTNPDGKPAVRTVQIISEGETLSVGAWLQLFQDASGGTLYVREYGLLFANRQSAPPDAQTLTEFWKQKPAEPKPAPAPDPKQK